MLKTLVGQTQHNTQRVFEENAAVGCVAQGGVPCEGCVGVGNGGNTCANSSWFQPYELHKSSLYTAWSPACTLRGRHAMDTCALVSYTACWWWVTQPVGGWHVMAYCGVPCGGSFGMDRGALLAWQLVR